MDVLVFSKSTPEQTEATVSELNVEKVINNGEGMTINYKDIDIKIRSTHEQHGAIYAYALYEVSNIIPSKRVVLADIEIINKAKELGAQPMSKK